MASLADPRPVRVKEPRYKHSRKRRRRQPRHAHSIRYRRSWQRKVVFTLAILAILGGLAIGAHIDSFYRHSHQVGSALIHTEEDAAASARASGKCVGSFPPSTESSGADLSASSLGAPLASNPPPGAAADGNPTVYALLKSPAIGLVAPVVEGIGDSELSVAVGHVPASSWPGPSGTSVLAAHDVTWFSHIDQLVPGSQVSVVTPCQTLVYTVQDHRVVSANTPIYQSGPSRLVLVTCYPLDALFLTSQRYLVEADLTRVKAIGARTHTDPSTAPPTVPAPPALAAQGLDLDHNPAPMGSLSITGSPSTGWQQSSGPLNDAGAALSLYFAAIRSAEQRRTDWWAAVAPGVPFLAAWHLAGGTIVRNDATLSPSLMINGSALTGVSLVTEPVLSGNDAPGIYRIEMTARVVNGQLVISGWSMQRVG